MGSTVKYAVQLDDQMSSDLKSLGGVVSSFDEKIDRLVSSLEGMKRAELEAAMAAREADVALRKEAEAADKAAKEAKEATDATRNLKQSNIEMASAAIAAATAVVAGLAKIIKSVTDTKNQFNDLAVESGFAAQTLQAFDLAARSGGDSLEQIAPSLKQFGKRIRDASLGTGEAAKSFSRLGISATDANGEMRDADSIFQDVTRSIQKVESATERAAIVNDLFGESGGRLLKMFNDSADSIEAYREKALALGVDLEKGSEGAAKLQISLADLETKLMGSADAIVQLLGGEEGVSKLIDNFILGFTFVEQIVLSMAKNWMAFLKMFVGNLTSLPRIIKAALSGESVKDAFTKPFRDFAEALENPFTNAVEAVEKIIKARQKLEDALSEPTTVGTGAGGLGSYLPTETTEGTTFATGASTQSAQGLMRAGLADVAAIRDAFSSEAIAQVEAQLGVTLSDFEEMLKGTTDVFALEDLREYIAAFSESAKSATDELKANAEANKKAAEEAAKLAEEQAKQRQANIQSGVGAALGGPQAILSAIGSTGPQGAIIAQVAGLLEAIGSSEEGASPLDQIPVFVDAITAGLERLGPILADVLPKLLTDSIPALIAAIPEAMIAIVDEAIPALLEAIPELIQVLITDVIPILSTYKVQIVKAVVTSVIPALTEALWELAKTLADPSYWLQAMKDVRRQIGAGLGQIFAQIVQGYADIGNVIQTVVQNAFSLEFWKSVLQGLIDAITDFEFNTPGLDAFRRNAGIETGGATGLRGLAERVGDRFDGGMTVNFNGLGFGDDRAILTRIANARNNRRTGARS